MSATEDVHEALQKGDATQLKHHVGDADQRADISGLKAMQKVDELVTHPAPVLVLLGKMGHGKTDASGLFGQRYAHHADGQVRVATNIKSLAAEHDDNIESVEFIADYPSLEEWIQQDGDPLQNDQTPKLFIGDEFSSAATGRGKQGYETAMKMAPLIYKIRKYNGALIYVAHSPNSIHPILRRIGTVIQKQSKKRAAVDGTVQNGEFRDPEFDLSGFPPTDWNFNDDEASPWSWERDHSETASGNQPNVEEIADSDDEARRISIATVIDAKQQGMSNREIAEFVPYSYK